jgi:hypothetical protein
MAALFWTNPDIKADVVKLRVFRIQPHAWATLVARTQDAHNRSEEVRRLLRRACQTPPCEFPVRGLKPDLHSFSVFLDEPSAKALRAACQQAGVSQSVFVEAAVTQ